MNRKIKQLNAFTLAEGGHSPLLCGDEGVAEGYSCVETKGHKFHHTSQSSSPCLVKRGFTLAEVLITLSVIGVVAAMTMPTLIQNYKKHVVETKLAKFYTTINQAVAMSTVQNGDPADWVKDCGTYVNPLCTTDEAILWFENYLGKYLNYSKIESYETFFLVYFNDGSIMQMGRYIYDQGFYISERAVKNPIRGINSFAFRFMPKLTTNTRPEDNIYAIKNTFEPFLTSWDGNIETLYKGARYSCQDGTSNYCTKIIQLNGWKIPKDYPLKF